MTNPALSQCSLSVCPAYIIINYHHRLLLYFFYFSLVSGLLLNKYLDFFFLRLSAQAWLIYIFFPHLIFPHTVLHAAAKTSIVYYSEGGRAGLGVGGGGGEAEAFHLFFSCRYMLMMGKIVNGFVFDHHAR
jgi:hypothetical protein